MNSSGPEGGEPDVQHFARYFSTQQANTYIRNALQKTEATSKAEVGGVGTTKIAYVTRSGDTQSKEAAAQSSDWLKELGNSTKCSSRDMGSWYTGCL